MGLADRLSPGTSSGGGGSTTLDARLRALGYDSSAWTGEVDPSQHSPQGPLGKVGGFFSNIWGDVGEMGRGFGDLAKMGVHDMWTGLKDIGDYPAMLFGKENADREYKMDDFAKAFAFDPGKFSKGDIAGSVLPGPQQYMQEAYGINPLRGDLWPDVKKTLHTAYHDPLQMALDVYGGASAVGRIRGGNALRGAKALDPDAPLTAVPAALQKRLPGLDPDSPLRSGRATIGEAVKAGEAGGVLRRLLEHGGLPNNLDDAASRVQQVKLPVNPVRRRSKLTINNALSRDVNEMPALIMEQSKKFRDAPDSIDKLRELAIAQPELAYQINKFLTAERHGVTRFDYDSVATFRMRAHAIGQLSKQATTFYNIVRDPLLRQIDETFKTLTKEETRNFHKHVQGLDPRKSPGSFKLEQVEQMLENGGDIIAKLPDVGEGVSFVQDATKKFTRLRERINNAHAEMQEHVRILSEGNEKAKTKAVAEIEGLTEEIFATHEHARSLSEYIKVADDTIKGKPVDPVAAAIAKIRWIADDHVADAIKIDQLGGYNEIMKRAYGTLLVERKAPRLKETDPATGAPRFDVEKFDYDSIAGDNPHWWKKVRDEFQEAPEPLQTPFYFPQFDPARVKASELLMKRGNKMLQDIEPFKKNEYINYIRGRFVTDPTEAYGRRMTHMARIVDSHKFFERMVKLYGRPLSKMDSLTHKEVYFSPTSVRQIFRTRGELDNALAEAAMFHGYKGDLNEMGKIIRQVQDEITAKRGLEGFEGMTDVWAIPKVVADQLENYSKWTLGSKTRIFVDGPTNVWRSAVLALSPRWVLNNVLGNTVFNIMQPHARMTDVVRQFSPQFRGALNDWIATLPPEIRAQVAEGLFGGSQETRTALGGAARTGAGRLLSEGAETGVYKAGSGLVRRITHYNEEIERAYRRASILGAKRADEATLGMKRTGNRFFTSLEDLEKLADSGISESQLGRMVEDMHYFMNDYSKQAWWEKNLVKRFIMPFWSFYKHSAKLFLSYPFKHPDRAVVMRMLGETADDIEQDIGVLPPYLESSVPIGEGEDGKTRFLNTGGANPFGGMIETLREPDALLSMTGPFLKTGYEYLTGEDTMTGRPFTSPDAAYPFGSQDAYKPVYDENGNIISMAPTQIRPGLIEQFTGQFPQSGLIKDAISMFPGVGEPGIQRRYDTGEEMGFEGAPEANLGQSVGKWAGYSTSDFDVGAYQEREAAQRRATLIQILRQAGAIPQPEE